MSRFLEYLDEILKTCDFPMTRITEIHNGVSETLEVSPQNPCQNCYSVAKTFTMTAIGLLYDKDLLKTEDRLCDILADELPESGMDERWRSVTVDMLLTHSAGLPGGFLDIDCNRSLDFTEDYLRYTLTYPLDYTPGTDSKYSDGAYYLLSRIVEKLTGMGTDNFLWKEILFKMEFQEMAWSHCPSGHVMGATGLYIHSSDMAKLGQLYLDDGMWKGERLLSPQWTEIARERCYGLDWNEDRTIYYKGGMCGQKLMVLPAQNRVVAVQSFGGNSGVIERAAHDYN